MQLTVMNMDPFSSATNPSGELIGRIRDARRAVTSKTFNTNARLAEDIELFISNSQVDERAAQALRSEAPDVQTAVLAQNALVDCTNPSATLMSRIGIARMAVQQNASTRHGMQNMVSMDQVMSQGMPHMSQSYGLRDIVDERHSAELEHCNRRSLSPPTRGD